MRQQSGKSREVVLRTVLCKTQYQQSVSPSFYSALFNTFKNKQRGGGGGGWAGAFQSVVGRKHMTHP